jgi:hypothetical protein
MSAEGELTFLREMASPAPLNRGPQAPPPQPSGGGGGKGGGPSWLQNKRSFSLKRPREEGAGGGTGGAPNNKRLFKIDNRGKGKSPPKKGKSPPIGHPSGHKKGSKARLNHNGRVVRVRIAAGGKSNKGVKKSPRIAAKKKSRGGWATE